MLAHATLQYQYQFIVIVYCKINLVLLKAECAHRTASYVDK